MKPFKILLSLHSIKLIFIAVLAIAYLAMTAKNSSSDEGAFSIAKAEGSSLHIVSSGPEGKK